MGRREGGGRGGLKRGGGREEEEEGYGRMLLLELAVITSILHMLTSIIALLYHLYKCTTTVVKSVVSFQYYSLSILLHGGSSGRTLALEMAGIQHSPSGPFNFKSPEEWPRWRRRYEQFQVASGLAAEPATKQVSTFLYCLGEESESVLVDMNASEDDRKDYAKIACKFEAFFNVRRNIIFERARFNRLNQLLGESAEQYIIAL